MSNWNLFSHNYVVPVQEYYRGTHGALVAIDLKEFRDSDKKERIIRDTKGSLEKLERATRANLPCLLVGTKARLNCKL